MYFTKRKDRIKNAFIKLQRVVIKQQKKKIIKQIEKIIGGSLLHTPIPDNSKDENDEVYVTNVPIYFISTTL